VTQKNGRPSHPQTQGKIERFHQTQKKWLARQTPAATLSELQAQLNRLRHDYNTRRPHRALDHATPSEAYHATIKVAPRGGLGAHYSVRWDTVDRYGKLTLRRAGRLHHLGIGIHHRGKRILALVDDTSVTVIYLDTGEIIATNLIDPDRSCYWRNTQKTPGRWPGAF
jgi:hypothetical protein